MAAFTFNLSDLNGSNGFALNGSASGDRAGRSVSNAGDINGDGIDDLIIGAYLAGPNGTGSGESYVVFGNSNGFADPFELSTLNGGNGFALRGGASGDYSGRSVSSAGDVNGDGIDDLIIGAYLADSTGTDAGKSYVVFGKSTSFLASLELSNLGVSDGFVINGAGASDRAGISVASAGDVNNDGIDDLIIGADQADPGGNTNAGAGYVVFGKAGFGTSVELSNLGVGDGFVVNGAAAGDRTGVSVDGIGDVNGDGIDDFIIGARYGDPGGNSNAGASYVVFGSSAGFATSVDLAGLDGSDGFVINGIDSLDQSGRAVSGAGDVNGDGIDDFIVGALYADPNGGQSGESYVVFGKSTGFAPSLELSDLSGNSNGFVIKGIAGDDRLGVSVSGAGDVSGDGIDDLVVSAFRADPNGNSDAGESYVVFGRTYFSSSLELSSLNGSNGFALNGIDGSDSSGRSVSGAGDVNGDGVDDLIIGAIEADPNGNSSGESYVVFGNAAPKLDLNSNVNAVLGFVLNGIDSGDNSGRSVSSAGDVNGDGLDDLIIGADRANPNGNFRAGESYVVFANSSEFAASLDLSSLDGSNGFVINGIDGGDNSGRSVSSAGDVNGDGIDDLIIGAYLADPNGNSDAGESYVVFGNASGFAASLDLSNLDGNNGFVLNGVDNNDRSGRSVSGAGDVNSDGLDDLIIGATEANANGNSFAGESYVVFGNASGFAASLNLSDINGSNGFVLDGIDSGDRSGFSVNSAGDINGDGIDDIIISAYRAGNSSGESYVVFGNASGFAASLDLSNLDGNDGFVLNGIDSVDFAGYSVSGAGDVNGDGVDDLIIGARSADPNGNNGAGESYVVFGNASGFAASLALSNLDGNDGFVLNGIDSNDASGVSVSSAGDVNGDGIDDLIIGGAGGDPGHASGESYVVFGNSNGFAASFDLSNLDGNNGFVLNSIHFEGIHSVSRAGDINGDGIDDLIIGAYGANSDGKSDAGKSYVILGGAGIGAGGSLALSDLVGTDIDAIAGTSFTTEYLGSPTQVVSNDLDIKNSNTTAFISSATVRINDRYDGASETLLVDTSGTGITESFDANSGVLTLSGLDTTENYEQVLRTVQYENVATAPTLFDRTISFTLNNNAAFNNTSATAFSTVTFNNAPELDLNSEVDAIPGFALNGIDFDDRSGHSVSSAGDINGDGLDDLIIGAYRADPYGKIAAGESYVVFGSTSELGASVELASLNGSNGFKLNGIDPFDYSGRSVSGAGDVNGDGLDDLIIGADRSDPYGKYEAGESYVVFGSSSGFAPSVELASLNGSNGFKLNGINGGDFSGRSVSSAGDMNGDGVDDIIIGAVYADPNGKSAAGESYVVFGSSSGFNASLNLASLNGSNGFKLNGINGGDFSGRSVSSAGDVNGDGVDDIIIGAYSAFGTTGPRAGQSYVVFGSTSGFSSSVELASLNGSNGFMLRGFGPYDFSGRSVSSAGDINGDGIDDIIIGAPYADSYSGSNNNAGKSYVVFGSSNGFNASIDLVNLNGSNGFAINGRSFPGYLGRSVSGAGDVNGDGLDDIIVGADNAGESYVVFGSSNGFVASIEIGSLDGSNGFAIAGFGDNSRYSVSGAGDVNGDGFDDLIVGARYADPYGKTSAGKSYVILGRSGLGASGRLNPSDFGGTDLNILGTGFTTEYVGSPVSIVSNNLDIKDDDPAASISGATITITNRLDGANESLLVDVTGTLIVANFDDATGVLTLSGTDTINNYEQVLRTVQYENTATVADTTNRIIEFTIDDSGFFNTTSAVATSTVTFSAAAPELDLNSTINPVLGFTLKGVGTGDESGVSVSGAGDVNGDGIDDLIIGAYRADPNGGSSGESYVVFGRDSEVAATIELSNLDGSDGFVLNGIDSGDYSGRAVSRAGDVNGDGIDDIIIGARLADPNGEGYVVFGNASGFAASIELSNLDGSNGFVLNGIGGSSSTGQVVSDAGDINGDGLADIIIGADLTAAGKSYVVFGSTSSFAASIELSSLDGSNGFVISGIDGGDRAGYSVSSAGDVNGDGIDDLIIGAKDADPNGNSYAGESYVVFGNSNGFASSIELSNLDGSNGFVLNGHDTFDQAGWSVSDAGDVNNDGIDDIIIGARGGDPNGNSYAGESYVVFGNSNGFASSIELSSLDGSNGFVLNGVDSSDQSGYSVSSAGDVNGDGIDDLIVGARLADPNGNSAAGESYVVFGSSSGFASSIELSSLDGSNGFVLKGIDSSGQSGRSVSGAGDINNDGIHDLIIGARLANGSAGESYVILGGIGIGASGSLELSDLSGTDENAIAGTGFTTEYTGSPLSIASNNLDIENSNPASSINGATITLTNRPDGSDESLLVDVTGTLISASFDAVTGILTLSGVETVANYEQVLRTVQYENSAVTPDVSDRLIEFTITNSATFNNTSAIATSTVTFSNAPTPGDDALIGTPGNDTIDLLAGNDSYSGLAGSDTVIGGDGNDIINGDDGDDFLNGSGGNDQLFGGSGNDVLGGVSGNDTLIGGDGTDFYIINSLNDVVIESVNEGIDRVQTTIDYTLGINVEQLSLIEGTTAINGIGNSLDNRLFGNSANNTLTGLEGVDVFFGRSGNDTLIGGDGNDVLLGESGDDFLEGGAGRDFLLGGDGTDAFVFTTFVGVDIVRDFDSATDVLDLSTLFSTFGYGGSDPLGDGYLRFGVVGVNTFVQVDADGSGGSNSQLANIAVLRDFTDTTSLQIGVNVLV